MNLLSYTMPGWWPWAAAIWLILVIVCGLFFTRRDHSLFSSRQRILLWLIRSVASGVLLMLILNWSSESTRKSEEKPLIHILTDRSASMATADAAGGSTRYDAARKAAKVIADSAPKSVSNFFSSDLETDSSEKLPNGERSAIGQALSRTLDNSRQQAIGGVILLSDFAATDEAAIKETLQIYQSAGPFATEPSTDSHPRIPGIRRSKRSA
jgi:hypothetical protein